MSATVRYAATFDGGDDEALVALAFSCPVCLACLTQAAVAPAGDDTEAWCRCALCAHTWTTSLDRWQLLRLLVSPPSPSGPGWRMTIRVDSRRSATGT